MRFCFIILCFIACPYAGFCQKQDSIVTDISTKQNALQSVENIPSKSLDYIEKKYSKLTGSVEKQSQKLLDRMQRSEDKLQKKLASTDSLKAQELFATSQTKYNELKEKIQSPVNTATAKLKEYIPGLDSMNTAMKFLQTGNLNLADDKLQKIQNASGQLNELQGRLQQANEIQLFIREREQQLKTALENTGLGKELLQINKQVYYYQQQLSEYKAMLHDPDKMEQKALEVLTKIPAFQNFMQKNSFLAQLFPTPDNYGTPAALAGLQTRSGVQSLLMQRMGAAGGTNPQQYLQQQVQQAQSQLNTLKDKINKLGGASGSSDMTMPDFKPSEVKTKTFLQRIEYGFNVQSSRSTSLLPATSDIAITAGYKMNDKISFGTGLSYKLGWGDGWNNVKISSQGIGLRSYADIKAKGSIWISGGFEYNYMQAFSKLEEIKNIDVWQRSALAGLTKKIKIGKKKESKVQLLYDFLARKQVPQTSAIKFRVGWNF